LIIALSSIHFISQEKIYDYGFFLHLILWPSLLEIVGSALILLYMTKDSQSILLCA